jgi:uncharacterized pyridoxal phosphate-containing UPF0001 family protein
MENLIRENLLEVKGKIQRAAQKSGRRADEIKLVAVSKTHPLEVLREAMAAGAHIFGENKVQEADRKFRKSGAIKPPGISSDICKRTKPDAP